MHVSPARQPTEQVVVFGEPAQLVGILTIPEERTPRETAVILLNAGVVHRVGPGRLYVTLARRLASAGFAVLRFDHAGIGDSPPREDNVPFDRSGVLDVQHAIDWLASERRASGVALVGLCASTLTAFRTAQADSRVRRLILLTALLQDPATVPQAVIDDAMERRVARSYLTEKVTSGERWRKVLSGKADYGRIAGAVAGMVRRKVAPAPPDPGTSEVVRGLEGLLHRGVGVQFVFAEPTTVLEYFRMTVAPHLSQLRRSGRIDATVLKGADHTFTQRQHQEQVIALAMEALNECS